MISAPSEILCSSMSSTRMNRKVTASTSGMVSATTSPAARRAQGLVCRPSATKLTASTISTASIRIVHELVHRRLDRPRLVGHRVQLDAHRQLAVHVAPRCVCEVLAQRDDVAALAPSTRPGRSTSWPLKRILSCGGSTYAALDRRRSRRAGTCCRRRAAADFPDPRPSRTAPVTRTCRLSVGVTSTPVASTAFCASDLARSALGSMPSWGKLACCDNST